MPLMRSESRISQNSQDEAKTCKTLINAPFLQRFRVWFLAARPKTWIASISPVLIGTVLAYHEGNFSSFVFSMTLLFSLLIQVGTNFANDYFDYIKGADTSERKGPKRAVEQGWISPRSMLVASLFVFLTSFLIAIPLMLKAGWWSYPLALSAIALGLLYTGGSKPLGYLGLGELVVFIFFGPIAVLGTYYLQSSSLNVPIFIASLAPAFLSCAILIANNLRDEKTDRIANKKTLVVRLGRLFGSFEYTLSILFASSIPFFLVLFFKAPPLILGASLILPASYPLVKKSFLFQDASELIPLLGKTAFLLISYTILFCLGLIW